MFTLPRVVGGCLELARGRGWVGWRRQALVVVASGLVLGEGLASVAGALGTLLAGG